MSIFTSFLARKHFILLECKRVLIGFMIVTVSFFCYGCGEGQNPISTIEMANNLGLFDTAQSQPHKKKEEITLQRRDHPIIERIYNLTAPFNIPIADQQYLIEDDELLDLEALFEFLTQWDQKFYKYVRVITTIEEGDPLIENTNWWAFASKKKDSITFVVVKEKKDNKVWIPLRNYTAWKQTKDKQKTGNPLTPLEKTIASRYGSHRALVSLLFHEFVHIYHFYLSDDKKQEIHNLYEEAGDDVGNYVATHGMYDEWEFFAIVAQAWIGDTEAFIERGIAKSIAGKPVLLKSVLLMAEHFSKHLEGEDYAPLLKITNSAWSEMDEDEKRIDITYQQIYRNENGEITGLGEYYMLD